MSTATSITPHNALGFMRALINAQHYINLGVLKARSKDIKAAELLKRSSRSELDPVKKELQEIQEPAAHVSMLKMYIDDLEEQFAKFEMEIEIQRKAKEALSRI